MIRHLLKVFGFLLIVDGHGHTRWIPRRATWFGGLAVHRAHCDGIAWQISTDAGVGLSCYVFSKRMDAESAAASLWWSLSQEERHLLSSVTTVRGLQCFADSIRSKVISHVITDADIRITTGHTRP